MKYNRMNGTEDFCTAPRFSKVREESLPLRRHQMIQHHRKPWPFRSLLCGSGNDPDLSGKVQDASKGKKKPETDGYFTVEAALVMPVVLSIIVMILYLSFYLYDRCIMAQDLYLLSYRQSIEKGNADRAGTGAVRAQLGGRVFMLSGLETETAAGGTVRLKGNAVMEAPVFGLALFDRQRRWHLCVEEKAKKTDPPKEYRRVRRLLYLASRVAPGQ